MAGYVLRRLIRRAVRSAGKFLRRLQAYDDAYFALVAGDCGQLLVPLGLVERVSGRA